MTFNWKIGGEAGFGIMTSGLAFSKIATRSGYHIFDYAEYPSLIRGGNNTYEVAVSDEVICASIWLVDILICLNRETFELNKGRLVNKSIVVYDPDMFEPEGNFIRVPIGFSRIKKELNISQTMLNTIAVAASIGILGGDLKIFETLIYQQFQKKGKEIIDFNIKLAKIGYEEALKVYKPTSTLLRKKDVFEEKIVTTGNDAFSLAVVASDCRYFAAYPMTPASSVLSTLASWQDKSQMAVRHPEDEISVINSALGAAFSGVRSSVSTSGGGFALMVEALSYSGIAEIPITVFLSMRPGPATGMPTWTEQGDLLFAVHAGHGEFPKIILAPGDGEEVIDLTLKAFELADIYQTPVLILSDKYISESHISQTKKEVISKFRSYKINRGKITPDTNQDLYLRYKLEKDGISEMLIPGKKGHYYQANSYEHLEDSHTTEESDKRKSQVLKRNSKMDTFLRNNFELPKVFGDLSKAEIIFVSWGSNKGPILEAMKLLENKKSAYIHFSYLYPLAIEPVRQLLDGCSNKRIICVENNSQSQFAQLLLMQTGIKLKEKLLKFDGRPFWPEEIHSYINGKTSSNKNITSESLNVKADLNIKIETENNRKSPKLSIQDEEEVLKKLEALTLQT